MITRFFTSSSPPLTATWLLLLIKMCSFFWQRMESDQQGGGDLGDIIRASSSCGGPSPTVPSSDQWQFPSVPNHPMTVLSSNTGFGDPFSNLGQDPLLHELYATTTPIKFPDSSISDLGRSSSVSNSDLISTHKILGEDKSIPCNIFSRFIQISPNARRNDSLVTDVIRPPPIFVVGGEMMKMGSSLPYCSQENTGLQISSSPQTPGIKRRKSQAKKVVCIPAPAAAGSRPSGEVVPSDLWAWRKYGQKPIKGSPYPRGYYRCSSSKGCSARKQVERSRTDPNMLVITYASEHNHQWPTQRNELAGSMRSQLSRTNPSTARNNSVQGTRTDVKKEVASGSGPVKEEKVPAADSTEDRDIDGRLFDDFFANLCELEADGMELAFSKEEDDDNEGEEEEQQEMDPTKRSEKLKMVHDKSFY